MSAPAEARPARTWQAEADRKDHPLGRLGWMTAVDPASPPSRDRFWSREAAAGWGLPLALFLACLAGAVLVLAFHLDDMVGEVANLLDPISWRF